MARRQQRRWDPRRHEVRLRQLAADIKACHGRVGEQRSQAVNYLRGALQFARMAGDSLIKAKKVLRQTVGFGERVPGFLEWVRAETGLSHRTANVYMRIARGWFVIERRWNGEGVPSMRAALALLRARREEAVDEEEFQRLVREEREADAAADRRRGAGDTCVGVKIDGDRGVARWRAQSRGELRRTFERWLDDLDFWALEQIAAEADAGFDAGLGELAERLVPDPWRRGRRKAPPAAGGAALAGRALAIQEAAKELRAMFDGWLSDLDPDALRDLASSGESVLDFRGWLDQWANRNHPDPGVIKGRPAADRERMRRRAPDLGGR
jgi:hypothetical protein